MSQIKSLNLYGPINSTGYGTHFFNWASAFLPLLVERGINCAVIPKNGQVAREEFAQEENKTPAGSLAIFLQALEAQATMEHNSDIAIMLWHAHQLSEFAGKVRIGYTVFETDSLRPEEQHHLQQCDYVAVPSHWHKMVLEALQIKKFDRILVWPEGVDHKTFHPIPLQARTDMANRGPLADPGCFTFVNVGKYEKRKGTPMLIEAFSQLADTMKEPEKPVRLLLSCFNPFLERQRGTWQKVVGTALSEAGFAQGKVDQERHYVTFTHHANPAFRVDLIAGWMQSKNDVMMLYRAADAGVFPYFAEGWCLPLIEAMACGLPCIAPFYSGPTEYLAKPGSLEVYTSICIPLLQGRKAVARDGIFFGGDQGNWLQVDQQELVQSMEKTITMPPGDFRDIGEHAASHVRSHWNWQQAARMTLDSLIANDLMR